MAIKYLKVFLDWNEVTSELNYEEKGRLIEAMIKYANGEADIQLSGNERFLFGIMKNQINREHENYEKVVEINKINGAKGGRPKKNIKPEETEKTHSVFEKAEIS
ncbi:MAG: hypothetical protein IJ389_00930, partial [Clostridia bacterium]|nr:hypothetical protein [Clostridia bacterium]